jgi:hypothetical protein
MAHDLMVMATVDIDGDVEIWIWHERRKEIQ